jgi:hypothetical protein
MLTKKATQEWLKLRLNHIAIQFKTFGHGFLCSRVRKLNGERLNGFEVLRLM